MTNEHKQSALSKVRSFKHSKTTSNSFVFKLSRAGNRRGSRGAKGALPPPSPQKIAPPNSQARIQGGQEGLAPPYKILDPPMGKPSLFHMRGVDSMHFNNCCTLTKLCAAVLKFSRIFTGRNPELVVFDEEMLSQIMVKEFTSFTNRRVRVTST